MILPKQIILTSFLITCFSFSLLAGKKERADKYYKNMVFEEAIPIYESLAEKGDSSIVRNLADSYTRIREFEKAEAWYSILQKKDTLYKTDQIQYARACRSNGNFVQFIALQNEFPAVANTFSTIEEKDVAKLKRLKYKYEKYQVLETNLNTPFSECSPSYFQDSLLLFMSGNQQVNNYPHHLFVANRTDTIHKFNSIRLFHQESTYQNVSEAITKNGVPVVSGGNTEGSTLPDSIQSVFNTFAPANIEPLAFGLDSALAESFPFIVPLDSVSNMGYTIFSTQENKFYFASNYPFTGHQGGYDLYFIEKKANGNWSEPKNLGENINTHGDEGFPFIQERTGNLFFSSDGHPGIGKLDVFEAKKLSDGTFGKIKNLRAPINSTGDDFGIVFNKQFTEGYLSSNRIGGKGDHDIYAVKVKDIKLSVNGKITNELDDSAMKGVLVKLFDGEKTLINSVETSSDGRYSFDVEHNIDYFLIAEKASYTIVEDHFMEEETRVKKITKNIVLGKLLDTSKKAGKWTIVLPVNFDYKEYNITETENAKLIELASILKQNTDVSIEVYSHTDCRGNNSYNESLSNKRANSIRSFLIQQGVKVSQITSFMGMGETAPLVKCECSGGSVCSDDQHRKNRRSEFVLKREGKTVEKIQK
ncbi:MAG: OmpA family protein [Cyclobacteriaceae bacterium]